MAFYVRGNAVANATSYELFEKKTADKLIDFATPTSAPACWSYDAAENVWKMTNSEYSNLRWDFELEGGVAYMFKFTFTELNGSAQATIRDSANVTLDTIGPVGKAGTYSREFTPTESGTYSFRITGISAPNSGTLSDASVSVAGGAAETSYVSLATANEINFNVSDLGLAKGNHTFVVRAKAAGFEDSDYSNEVVYTAK